MTIREVILAALANGTPLSDSDLVDAVHAAGNPTKYINVVRSRYKLQRAGLVIPAAGHAVRPVNGPVLHRYVLAPAADRHATGQRRPTGGNVAALGISKGLPEVVPDRLAFAGHERRHLREVPA